MDSTRSVSIKKDSIKPRRSSIFLKGPPHVALNLVNPFNAYVFVDNDPMRIAESIELKAQYGITRNITVQESAHFWQNVARVRTDRIHRQVPSNEFI